METQTTSACSNYEQRKAMLWSVFSEAFSTLKNDICGSTNWTGFHSSTGNPTYVPRRTSSQLQNPYQHQHPALQTSRQAFFHLSIHARHLLLSASLKPLKVTKDLSSPTVRPCKPLPTGHEVCFSAQTL